MAEEQHRMVNWELTPPMGTRFINQVGGSVHLHFAAGREEEMVRHIEHWLNNRKAQLIAEGMYARLEQQRAEPVDPRKSDTLPPSSLPDPGGLRALQARHPGDCVCAACVSLRARIEEARKHTDGSTEEIAKFLAGPDITVKTSELSPIEPKP
jgi:hypothetical protein